jgi:hypothetical protein
MKKLINALFLLILSAFLLVSCEEKLTDKDTPGSITFSLNADAESPILKATPNDSLPENSYQLMVSISDKNGSMIFEDELVPLYRFSDGFISARLDIKPGEYNLTKFLVINPMGEIIFASPLEGAPLAYLINNPLPLYFSIYADKVTKLVPEVLEVNDNPPEAFGYASFGFQVVKPLTVYLMAINDDPRIMAPTRAIEAKVEVYTENGWSYKFALKASVNKVILRGGSRYYTILAYSGEFDPVKMVVPIKELMETTIENPLLIKFSYQNTQKIVLRPGPEAGKDATITDLNPERNFGDDIFFEATFKSEEILTVMRTKNSLVQYNLNDIPKSAKIEKVMLRLYLTEVPKWDSTLYYLDGTRSDFAWFGVVLQQIVEPWEEYKVNWNNQPKTIEANQVYVAPDIWRSSNIVDVDVSSLFVPMQEIAAPNFGMMLKQYPSNQFPGLKFASSDFKIPEMRPELTVYYSIPIY